MLGKEVNTVRTGEERIILENRAANIRAQQQKVRTCGSADIYHSSVVTCRFHELFSFVVQLGQLQVDRCLVRVCSDKRALEALDGFERSARA